MDKAGQGYWDRGYQEAVGAGSVRAFDPHAGRVRDVWKEHFHRYFESAFAGLDTRSCRLVEVGAGGSTILPYFGREYGFEVVGLDYSPTGCDLARLQLQREGIHGDVLCADVFAPPVSELERSDVVVSFGVAEHFSDPADCVRACARLLKPGGLMITTVPNMAGLVGWLQKLFDRSVFEKHVALDSARLREAHVRSGLTVLDVRYVMFAHLGVVNINDVSDGIGRTMKNVALTGLKGATALLWATERYLGQLPANARTSPYIFCLARKAAT